MPGEGQPAGQQSRLGKAVPCAILMVSEKRISSAGELDADLMTSACTEADVDQCGFVMRAGNDLILQLCFFDA